MWMVGISLPSAYHVAEHIRQLFLSLGALEMMFMAAWQFRVGDVSLVGDICRTLLVF